MVLQNAKDNLSYGKSWIYGHEKNKRCSESQLHIQALMYGIPVNLYPASLSSGALRGFHVL